MLKYSACTVTVKMSECVHNESMGDNNEWVYSS